MPYHQLSGTVLHKYTEHCSDYASEEGRGRKPDWAQRRPRRLGLARVGVGDADDGDGHSDLGAGEIVAEAMRIASEICVFTNAQITVEELSPPSPL